MRTIANVKSVFVAAFLLAVAGLNAAPFTNGNFDLINNHAAIPYGSGSFITPGGTWLTGWTVGGPTGVEVAVCNGPGAGLTPPDGQQWIRNCEKIEFGEKGEKMSPAFESGSVFRAAPATAGPLAGD